MALNTQNLLTLTAQQLAEVLVGQGITVTNVKLTGDPRALGTFNGGLSEDIGIESGVILSTGNISQAGGPNNSDGISQSFLTAGDPDLNALINSQSTEDAVILEFDFIPTQNKISFQYVFASEEYNEYVGDFNDVVGFFLNGQNVAILPGTNTPLAINNVNNNLNSQFYVDNDPSELGSPTPFKTQFDGFTKVLTAEAVVNPGQVNKIKIAIADNNDTLLDSVVFLKAESFNAGGSPPPSNPENQPPVALNDRRSTQKATPITLNVLANDSDPEGDPLTVEEFTQPANGKVVVGSGGILTYSPNVNFTGEDTFTYTVSDGKGGTANATVSIDVSFINTPPLAVDDEAVTPEDTPVTINVLDNDRNSDPGETLQVSEVTSPANGQVTQENNRVIYTPNPDFNGTDPFTYTLRDSNGAASKATVNVTVTAVVDEPTAVDDQGTTQENTPITLNVLTNDRDQAGGTLTLERVAPPANGQVINNGNGTVTYTPNQNFSAVDTFTYTISNPEGGTATAKVSVTVDAVNQGPVATNDNGVTSRDVPILIDVLANDRDPDGDVLIFEEITQPANGRAGDNGNGRILYTPKAGFLGVDSFIYTVGDGNGNTANAQVTVTVVAGVESEGCPISIEMPDLPLPLLQGAVFAGGAGNDSLEGFPGNSAILGDGSVLDLCIGVI